MRTIVSGFSPCSELCRGQRAGWKVLTKMHVATFHCPVFNIADELCYRRACLALFFFCHRQCRTFSDSRLRSGICLEGAFGPGSGEPMIPFSRPQVAKLYPPPIFHGIILHSCAPGRRTVIQGISGATGGLELDQLRFRNLSAMSQHLNLQRFDAHTSIVVRPNKDRDGQERGHRCAVAS